MIFVCDLAKLDEVSADGSAHLVNSSTVAAKPLETLIFRDNV